MSAPGLSDAALWSRLRSGDQSAWGGLFDRYAQQVYRFGVRILGSATEAEEALSETFLEVWRSRESFDLYGDSAAPVLMAIARRVCQKRLRAEQRRRSRQSDHRFAPDTRVEDIADRHADEDELLQRRRWLRAHVEQLPPPYRDVYELVVYAELPHEAAAQALGVAVGTVKSRMSRARELLTRWAAEAADEQGTTTEARTR